MNDNGETVKVKISNARLCNDASQTLSITRAEATGTIRNSDPLPQAFRFSLFPSLVQATPSNRAEATPGVGALDFAHFANGEGIISDLVLMNVATHPIRPVLYFYDKEGHPIAAESMVDLTEDSGGHGGRWPEHPDGDGAAGSAHDFDPWAGGAGVRIGDGAL